MAARRWGPQLRVAGVGAAASIAVVLACVAGAAVVDRSFRFFSKEPAETLEAPFYIGWFAHVASFTWVVGATSALVVGLALRRPFLLWAGGLTAAMALDDWFLLHDGLYPKAGIPEEAVYAAYGAVAVALARRFGRDILDGEPLLLALGVVAWVLSVGADVVQESTGRHLHVWEDGAKLVGVVLWSTFFVRASIEAVRGVATAAVANRVADAPKEPYRTL